MPAADAALIRDGERAAFHLLQRQFALARLRGQFLELGRKFEQALFVRVADHRHEQSGVRIHRDTDVIILFEHDLAGSFVEARIKHRMVLERRGGHLQRERR